MATAWEDTPNSSLDASLPSLPSSRSLGVQHHVSRKSLPTPEKARLRASSKVDNSSSALAWMSQLMQLVALGMLVVIFFMAVIQLPSSLIENGKPHSQVLTALFLTGIAAVALEDFIGLDKSAVVMIVAGVMWAFHADSFHPVTSTEGHEHFKESLHVVLAEVAEVVLFLLSAMAIVESIDHYKGFSIVTAFITRRTEHSKGLLMPMICIITFFLSAMVDNLTSTIIVVKILRSVLPDQTELRHACGGLAVLAANAGGAWSPVGDVTTTMLWVQGKLTTASTVAWLLLPSLVSGVVPMAGIWWQAQDSASRVIEVGAVVQRDSPSPGNDKDEGNEVTGMSTFCLCTGFLSILSVPILKVINGLPPYLGMMMALGTFWLIVNARIKSLGRLPHDSLHDSGILEALHKVDLASLLFFTGVLLAVGCLDSSGVLEAYAETLVELTGNNTMFLCSLLGISSAVVDNVPLVQASINMFDEEVDSPLWQLVAFTAGVGGSLLPMGSVAGVTLMGLDKVTFIWYCKNISFWAVLGFALGLATYQLERSIFGS